jgi:hypothetical protein
MSNEFPVAFRFSCRFRNSRPRDELSRPGQHSVYPTTFETETARLKRLIQFGDVVGIHSISPVHVTGRAREARLRKRHLPVAAAWHTETRSAGRR